SGCLASFPGLIKSDAARSSQPSWSVLPARVVHPPQAGFPLREESWRADSCQQVCHLLLQSLQIVFQDAPNRCVLDGSVTMDQHVAEANDLPYVRDAWDRSGILFFRLHQGFANRDELPFNGGAQEIVGLVIRKRPPHPTLSPLEGERVG